MIREQIIASVRGLAEQLGAIGEGCEWFILGSARRGPPNASEIDLMIICSSDAQTDALRHAIAPNSLSLPIYLALLPHAEVQEVNAVEVQQMEKILPKCWRYYVYHHRTWLKRAV